MTDFKLTVGIKKAGWVLGVGDALRAAGNSLAILMLAPKVNFVGPLFRVRIGPRSSVLEVRKHTAKRCTRGRWEKLDSTNTPKNAKEWAKLAKFWAWYSKEISSGRKVLWSWGNDLQKNYNLCHTRINTERFVPSFNGGLGRGRKVKKHPSGKLIVGYTPATGNRLCTHKD